jgi:preprotein translocase subunit SecA
LELIRVFSAQSPFEEEEFLKGRADELSTQLFEKMWDAYKRKDEIIAQQANPVIKDVYETKAEMYKNIVVPISDGQKVYQITTNLKKAYETESKELVRSFQKASMLVTIDDAWKEHLRELDDLRQAVQNATYEQKDPLLIYKFESFNLFKAMVGSNNKDVVSLLSKGHIPIQNADGVQEAQERKRQDYSKMQTRKDEFSRGNGSSEGGQKKPERVEPVRVEKKVGRNEPCPCGSGKKYKQCHGK